jgi:hypothetical protein
METPPQKLVEYERYDAAQASVDKLSDDGFPVEHVSIVWSRLRQIEYVTGRRTIVTAAMHGALSGMWFGAFIGLLLSLFVELEEGATEIGLIVSYALTGAVVVAVYQAVRHWTQRGRRDFSTMGKLDAEAYEIWVQPEQIHRAAALLGVAVPTADEDEDEDEDAESSGASVGD